MSCEKYSGWLTDAALGELRAEREPELLAHAMECDACREALSHERAVQHIVDRSVEALVAGEPTPQFARNLQRRIAQESGPRRFPWTAWTPVIAGAFALAVVLAIIAARKPVHDAPYPSVASAVTTISAPAVAVTESAAGPKNMKRTEAKRDNKRSAPAPAVTVALPEVIVPRGQLSAAAQLSAAIVTGRVNGYQLLAVQREYEKPLDLKPIEIAPMEVPALDTATEKPASSIQF